MYGVFIEDVFFLHRVEDHFYGYFDGKAYEFELAGLTVSATCSVDFAYKYPGNAAYQALPCGNAFVGVVEDCVFRFYQWGINFLTKLPFRPRPFSFYVDGGALLFASCKLDVSTLQIVDCDNFPPNALVFSYRKTRFYSLFGKLAVYKGRQLLHTVVLPIEPESVVSCSGSIAILTDGNSTLLVNLARYPPEFRCSRVCRKLHFAHFFARNGTVYFTSPAVDRKWSAGLLLARMLESEKINFDGLEYDFLVQRDGTGDYVPEMLPSMVVGASYTLPELEEALCYRFDAQMVRMQHQLDTLTQSFTALAQRQDALALLENSRKEKELYFESALRDFQVYIDKLSVYGNEQQQELDELRARLLALR